MRHRPKILDRSLLIVVLLSSQFCAPARGEEAQATLPSISLPPALDRVLRDYEEAWKGRNADALAALFAEDGFVLSDRSPAVRGRAAIRAAYANAGGGLSLRALGYSASDTVGYIIGMFARQTGQPDVGKFVLALRRSPDGPWQIAADIDNSIGR